jgi:predicted ATP-binding protein involved in virulence
MMKRLEEVVSEIIGKNVVFDLEENPFRVVVLMDGVSMDFDSLPDGLKSIVSWMGDLLMRMQRVRWKNNVPVFQRRFILFLDEIEVHLHPAWQRKILPIVQKLFVNAQIFISTHSPFVVGSVDDAWVYKLKYDSVAKNTTVDPPTLSQDGQSFVHILKEIFDVQEQFGPAVEKSLDEFYGLRGQVLASQSPSLLDQLISFGETLKGQSEELDMIVEMEIRQVKRQFPKVDLPG